MFRLTVLLARFASSLYAAEPCDPNQFGDRLSPLVPELRWTVLEQRVSPLRGHTIRVYTKGTGLLDQGGMGIQDVVQGEAVLFETFDCKDQRWMRRNSSGKLHLTREWMQTSRSQGNSEVGWLRQRQSQRYDLNAGYGSLETDWPLGAHLGRMVAHSVQRSQELVPGEPNRRGIGSLHVQRTTLVQEFPSLCHFGQVGKLSDLLLPHDWSGVGCYGAVITRQRGALDVAYQPGAPVVIGEDGTVLRAGVLDFERGAYIVERAEGNQFVEKENFSRYYDSRELAYPRSPFATYRAGYQFINLTRYGATSYPVTLPYDVVYKTMTEVSDRFEGFFQDAPFAMNWGYYFSLKR